MNIIVSWLINTLVIIVAAYIVPGVRVDNFVAALITALVLGIINAFIRPILLILTLPINILTLGLFTFVIMAFLVWLAAQIVPGFRVDNFGSALLFAIVVAVINGLLALIFPS
jgi:putative membrane protein